MQLAEDVVEMLKVRSVVLRKDDDVVYVRDNEVKVMKDFVHHSLKGGWRVPKSVRCDAEQTGPNLQTKQAYFWHSRLSRTCQ